MRDTRTQREDSVKDASLGFFLSPGKGRQECHALAVASPKKPVSVPAGSSSSFPGRIGLLLGPRDQETTILLAPAIPRIAWVAVFLWAFCVMSLLLVTLANAQESKTEGYATWYSRASALREQPQYQAITASGEPLDNNAFTCALPSRDFGKTYRIKSKKTKKTVLVKHTDFGPSKKCRKKGIIVDLTPEAFLKLGHPLSDGKITVEVTRNAD